MRYAAYAALFAVVTVCVVLLLFYALTGSFCDGVRVGFDCFQLVGSIR